MRDQLQCNSSDLTLRDEVRLRLAELGFLWYILSIADLSPSRPGNESQKLTRLGLAKSSKLNQRYEVDKPNLAKTSTLNKRYHLVEADVAVGVGISTRNNEHPGLSNSQLNRRYRSTQSIGHNDNDAVESDTNSDGQLMASRRKQKTTGKDNMPPKKNENRPPAKKASSSDVRFPSA